MAPYTLRSILMINLRKGQYVMDVRLDRGMKWLVLLFFFFTHGVTSAQDADSASAAAMSVEGSEQWDPYFAAQAGDAGEIQDDRLTCQERRELLIPLYCAMYADIAQSRLSGTDTELTMRETVDLVFRGRALLSACGIDVEDDMDGCDPRPLTYGGVGLVTSKEPGEAIIIRGVGRGTDAQREGLKKGDKIVRIGEIDVQSLSHKEAVAMMRGPVGSPVVLGVLNEESGGLREITLIRKALSILGVSDSYNLQLEDL